VIELLSEELTDLAKLVAKEQTRELGCPMMFVAAK
jgi:hypothetical protein